MAREKRIYMPLSYGGLLRYHEEKKSKIILKPKHIIWVTVAIVIFELLLRVLL
jgi:preprotein translocase subunit Sec61beta